MIFDWLFGRRNRIASEHGEGTAEGYRVFTKSYDEVVDASLLLREHRFELVATEAATNFRDAMLDRISGLTTRSILAAEAMSITLDKSRAPLVSLLIDLSGSMKGASVQLAAYCAEALIACCDAAGANFEILGFTTVDWRGAPVRNVWKRMGSPPNPGRLCALRHIVFSPFGSRRRPDLGLLFVGSHFFRENVDGEAIEWALSRLKAADGTHRLLIYLSDGAPVDDSSLACNPPDILWNHLKQVLASVREDRSVRLSAIGIRHSVANLVAGAIEIGSFNDVDEKVVAYLASELQATIEASETHEKSDTTQGPDS